jgi:serine/threonine-protein kinase
MVGVQAHALLIGRYRLDRTLATGGMGQVWLAHDLLLGRDVALKALSVDSDEDPESLERFRREAHSMAALQHPNVVTVFDSGTDQGLAFIVMELLPGPTLAQYVADRGPLPEAEVKHLASQVAAGLAAAHGAGLVHRDIKPANVMFDSAGMLKIVDFGIARLSQSAGGRLTASGTVIGSAPYLSPEQIQGLPTDERSDLYALGCVMVFMLTGRPPFEAEHPMAVVQQHLTQDPPRISDRRPGVSPELEALVLQLLDKSPQVRPASAEDVAARLAYLPSTAGAARLPPATAAVSQPATVPMRLQAMGGTEVARRSAGRAAARRPWWTPAAALVLALGLLGLLLVLLLSEEEQQGGERAAASTPSVTAEPTTSGTPVPTPSSTSPSPGQRGSSPRGLLTALRASVSDAAASGELEAKKAEELSKRIDDLAKKLGEDRGNDADKKLEEVSRYLQELVDKGDLAPEAHESIRAALRDLAAAAGD